MVISGKIRGNAQQLAGYLLSQGENEEITILDVDGRRNADASYLKDILHSMDINSELTKSRNSVYHAFINPNPTEKEDRAMTAEEWQRSADILAKHLSLDQQRRVIVLHEKKGRIHAHVVFERFNHDKGVMVDYKNNYKAHDKARFQMEKEFDHKKTPQKNPNLNKHKKTLTEIWNTTKTGKEFIQKAQENGYKVSKGTDRPFRIVDENGRSFDLARQIIGVKTKEIRQRIGNEKLMDDKAAIEFMNGRKNATKLKQNVESITDKTNISSSKPKDMSFYEIHKNAAMEKQLFKDLGKEALREMKLNHYTIVKEFGGFSNIPKEIKERLLDDCDQWENTWGKDSAEAEKIQNDYDEVMDKSLQELYKDDIEGKHRSNAYEITNMPPKPNTKAAFQEQVQEQQLTPIKTQEREIQLKELKDELEQSRNQQFGRNFN